MTQIPSPAPLSASTFQLTRENLAAADAAYAAVDLIESNYTAHGGAHANVGAGLIALERSIAVTADAIVLTNARIATASKAFSFADIAALGAATGNDVSTNLSLSVDFDAPLPAGAIVIGAGVNVTAALHTISNDHSCTIALGVKGGDADGFMLAGSANTICKLGTVGVLNGSFVGAITPTILMQLAAEWWLYNKGTATAYVSYKV